MKVLILIFLSATLLSTACASANNRPPSVANQNSAIDTSYLSPGFQTTARTIKNQNPEISDGTLTADLKVINEAQPEITEYFQKEGFSREQAEEAMLSSWQDLRLQQANQATALNRQDFTANATNRGLLVIKSSPPGATVMIGDKKLDEPTETDWWLPAGNYLVQLSKPDHESVSEMCRIYARKRTEFMRELPPKAK